jgi:alanyl-tRNA synthetase
VNEIILDARPVRAAVMPLDQARRLGARALFGEKYGERVRVITVKDYSREFCGGTHLTNTSQIGAFLITSESSVASGVRRIEAVTGWGAYERVRAHEQLIAELSALVRSTPAELGERIRRLVERARTQERAPAQPSGPEMDLDRIVRASFDVDGVRVVTARIDSAPHEALRLAGDRLRDQLGPGAYLLGGVADGRVNLVAMVSPDLHGRGVRADALLRPIAARIGGTGGGRADLAQGGGLDAARLDEALDAAADEVRHLVGMG